MEKDNTLEKSNSSNEDTFIDSAHEESLEIALWKKIILWKSQVGATKILLQIQHMRNPNLLT